MLLAPLFHCATSKKSRLLQERTYIIPNNLESIEELCLRIFKKNVLLNEIPRDANLTKLLEVNNEVDDKTQSSDPFVYTLIYSLSTAVARQIRLERQEQQISQKIMIDVVQMVLYIDDLVRTSNTTQLEDTSPQKLYQEVTEVQLFEETAHFYKQVAETLEQTTHITQYFSKVCNSNDYMRLSMPQFTFSELTHMIIVHWVVMINRSKSIYQRKIQDANCICPYLPLPVYISG